MSFGDGAKIQTKNRIGDDQHIDGPRQLSRQYRALYIAPGQRGNRRIDALGLATKRRYKSLSLGL